MKKAFCLLVFTALLWTSCSNEFDVNAEWEEFGILYSLLDLSKDKQYVRVNKAFLDDIEPIQSATEIASSSPDSIYFSDNISVWLDEYNANNTFIRKIDLGRVSSAETNLGPKEEGVFNNSEYYVYTSDQSIKNGHSYEVKVVTDKGTEMSASTGLADNFEVSLPVVTLANPALSNSYEMAAFEVLSIAWTRSKNASIYDVILRTNIQEFNATDQAPQNEPYDIYWSVASNIVDTQPESFATMTLDFQYESYLTFLQNKLDPNPDVFRRIEFIEFVVNAGTKELERFRDVSISSGSSLNAGQAKPIFTNIENGLGLFASVNSTRRRVLRLSNNTREDIACNPITADLNFSPDLDNLADTCP